jgi:hypothetical protein
MHYFLENYLPKSSFGQLEHQRFACGFVGMLCSNRSLIHQKISFARKKKTS